MTDERYRQLQDSGVEAELEEAEYRLGWHWCADWDFLLVGPGMPELEACGCPEGVWARRGGS